MAIAGSSGGRDRGAGGDHARDLQRGGRRVGARPPGPGAGGDRHRQRHREAAVLEAHRVEPVAERRRLRRAAGLREHLERVQRRGGLALRRAQVALQAPAVAAVGVAVAVERGERAGGVAAAVEQLEAAAVEGAGVGGHEVAGRVHVDAHAVHAPASARRRLVENGHPRRGAASAASVRRHGSARGSRRDGPPGHRRQPLHDHRHAASPTGRRGSRRSTSRPPATPTSTGCPSPGRTTRATCSSARRCRS